MSIYGEVPSGTVNGTNRVFTLSNPYAAGTTRVFVGTTAANAARQENGVAYTETTPASGVLTFATAPATGAIILVDYDLQATATTTAVGTWTFSPDGYPAGSAMYYGPVLWPSGTQPGSTSTGVCVFGPNGARVSVPPLAQGDSGLSPTIEVGSVSTLAAGQPATFELTPLNSNGPGVSVEYSAAIGLPQGEQGPAFETEILSASDLTGTPAAGYTLAYVPAQGNTPAQTAWAAMPFSSVYNVPNISNTGTNGGEDRTLAPLSIPPQPNLWVPVMFAQSTITGTANTAVSLIARQNNGTTAFNGSQWAVANPVAGVGPATATMIPASTTLLQGDSGAIPANTAATFYLNAEQQASTTDEYSTSSTTWWLGVLPVGIIASNYVALDLTGPGLSVASGTGSMTFTAGANDNYAIAALAVASSSNIFQLTGGINYGSTPMTAIGGTQAIGNTYVQLYGLPDPPAGPQTVAPAVTGGTVSGIVSNVVSFQNWSTTSFVYSTGGAGTSLTSDAVVVNAGQMAFCAMVSLGTSPIVVTSANTTTVYAKNAGAANLNLAILTEPGSGGAVEFTATTSASQPWACALVTLI